LGHGVHCLDADFVVLVVEHLDEELPNRRLLEASAKQAKIFKAADALAPDLAVLVFENVKENSGEACRSATLEACQEFVRLDQLQQRSFIGERQHGKYFAAD